MKHGWKKLAATLAAGVVVMMMMVGCSSNSPVAPSDSPTEKSTPNATETNLGSSVEVYGTVGSIDVATRTYVLAGSGISVTAESGAEIVYKDGGSETPIEFADIMLGDSVEARGSFQVDNSLLADRIRVRPHDDNGNGEVEFGGIIESIDPLARTMTLVGNPTLINIMDMAEITNHDQQSQLHIAELMVGDSVEVRGTSQPDGSVLADRVRFREPDDSNDGDIEFYGTISTIDYQNGSFTVAERGETILVDSNTVVHSKLSDINHSMLSNGDDDGEIDDRDTVITFTDLKAGDRVEVHANVVDPNTLYATDVKLEDKDGELDEDVEFTAFLASVDVVNGVVTFEGQSWVGMVVTGAQLTGHNNEPLTLADFSAGELVEIKGFPGEGDALDIVRIHKENNF